MDNQVDTEPKDPQITSRVLTSSEMIDLIYKGESLPQDPRFRAEENGGVFKYFNLRNLSDIHAEKRKYTLLEVNGLVVGVAELEDKSGHEDITWIKFLTIDPEFKGKGYGTKLAEAVFKYAKDSQRSLETSSYSQEGYARLKHIFNRLAEETGVAFQDTDRTLA